MLAANPPAGELVVASSATWAPKAEKRKGAIEAKADLDLVRSRIIQNYDLTSGVFHLKTPMDVPAETSLIVLTIEEMKTGLWGSTRFVID